MYESAYYTLSLWDTAGPEGYDRVKPLSYADSDVILVCYSLTDANHDSFQNVKSRVRTTRDSFNKHGLSGVRAWISNHMYCFSGTSLLIHART